MKRISLLLVFLAILLLRITCLASTVNRGMFWIGADFDGTFKQGEAWHYNGLIQPRLADTPSKLQQLFMGSSIYYEYDNGLSLWFGYNFIPTNGLNQPISFLEQRVWPQLEYVINATPHLNISLRTRFEYRWLSNSNQQGERLRQRLGFIIRNTNRFGVDYDIFDELFLNVNNAAWANHTVGQNRVFLGLIFPVHKDFAIDIGYLNIYFPRPTVSLVDHVFILMLSTNFDGKVQIPLTLI